MGTGMRIVSEINKGDGFCEVSKPAGGAHTLIQW